MITPIFFPFTHMTRSQEDTVTALFGPVYYFPISDKSHRQPIRSDHDRPSAVPIYGNPDLARRVLLSAGDFTDWARTNQGNEINLRAFFDTRPFLTSDTGVPALKAGILNPVKGNRPSRQDDGAETADPLFRAMLFLCLAQSRDAQKEAIRDRFSHLLRSHDSLFEQLTPENGSGSGREPSDPSVPAEDDEDPGSYMTARRVQAWFTFFLQDICTDFHPEHPVFITTSEAVFEYLISFGKNRTNALDIDSIKVHENNCIDKTAWQKRFADFIGNALSRGLRHDECVPGIGDECIRNARIKLNILSKDDCDTIRQNRYETVPVCLVQ